jgi:hypothetical protein
VANELAYSASKAAVSGNSCPRMLTKAFHNTHLHQSYVVAYTWTQGLICLLHFR